MESHIRDKKAEFGGRDYKPNMWHSVCTTWDSVSGLVQLWFDGQPSIRKFTSSGLNIKGPAIIILGQVRFYGFSLFILYRFHCKFYTVKLLFTVSKFLTLYRSRMPTVGGLMLSSLSLVWCVTSTCGITPFPHVRSRAMWMNWTSLQGMCLTGELWNIRFLAKCF